VAPVSDRARMGHGAAAALLEMAFCLVELRGLEPLTPCLQNTSRLSGPVAHLDCAARVSAGIGPSRVRLWSALVISNPAWVPCGRAHSRRTAPDGTLDGDHRSEGGPVCN